MWTLPDAVILEKPITSATGDVTLNVTDLNQLIFSGMKPDEDYVPCRVPVQRTSDEGGSSVAICFIRQSVRNTMTDVEFADFTKALHDWMRPLNAKLRECLKDKQQTIGGHIVSFTPMAA